MATTPSELGFRVIREPPVVELDIVFVHGLLGHRENTWTYDGKNTQAIDRQESTAKWGHWSCFGRKDKKQGKQSSSLPQPSPGPEGDRVFWPGDLLVKHASCTKARILTYGYDSDIVKLGSTPNFNSIRDHGESLLNGVARHRKADRPLMFIAHSLGGLVVKWALNSSYIQSDETAGDLRAVFESTFAIIFFGTPHRGSSYAELGRKIAKLYSAATMGPYNDAVIKNLVPNEEVLADLRTRFESTVKRMIKLNAYESSTFKEGRGFSGVKGLQGKVVEDDSAEMGESMNDRADTINGNHMEICRFSDANDPEYDKVAGEISRHISRLRDRIGRKQGVFVASLRVLKEAALENGHAISRRSDGTLDWLYTATAIKNEDPTTPAEETYSLETWLRHGSGLFWITGRPGSGKSTAMRHAYESAETPKYLASGYDATTEWCLIALFVTNRGSQEQIRWETMLHGILGQLLDKRPDLIHDLMARGIEWKRRIPHQSRDPTPPLKTSEEDTYNWTTEGIKEALRHCKKQRGPPLKVLILFDGLDELERDRCKEAGEFLKELSDETIPTANTFRVLIASRAEITPLDLFKSAWRIWVHHHTRGDIRNYVESTFNRNERVKEMDDEARAQLQNVVRYVTDEAHGVFLWARSVTSIADEALSARKTLDEVRREMEILPSDMNMLYKYILEKKVDPQLRQKAYFMLEVILRARKPLTPLQLALIVRQAEHELAPGDNQQRPISRLSDPDTREFVDDCRLHKEILACCKCLLETSQRHEYLSSSTLGRGWDDDLSDDNMPDDDLIRAQHGTRVSHPRRYTVRLLHRSARDFLLEPGCLDVLFPPEETSRKPAGNGHVYTLLFARRWLRFSTEARNRLRCDFPAGLEVLFHAERLERTLGPSASDFFALLDDIDFEMAKSSPITGEDWPAQFTGEGVKHWGFTFPAFAVAADMRGYVDLLVRRAENAGERQDFLNGKEGRPLLHFSVFMPNYTCTPSPRITKFLLEQGADINATFDGKTAVESLVLHDNIPAGGGPHLEVLELLINKGANANSRYYHNGCDNGDWQPLTHLTATAHSINTMHLIKFLKLLRTRGADLNGTNSAGSTLMEALYWRNTPLLNSDWKWLFKNGAKVTRRMVNANSSRKRSAALDHNNRPGLGSNGNWESFSQEGLPLPQLRNFVGNDINHGMAGICDDNGWHNAYITLRKSGFRVREWYRDDAAAAAERSKPDWFKSDT